ncbi:MAG TPA: hypothetical protein DET40_16245 [Lentisphaeria bacterium]|nr:MAG: hypothetical protein A2X45_22625 [Lentisphaerae bacterium GWF2_50_93]HCE45092.1 hypothetical protein [Lentisphaeria bacterium]
MSLTFNRRLAKFAAIPAFAVALFISCAGFAQENLIRNADFKTDANNDGVPDGWSAQKGISYPAENGRKYLKIEGGQASTGIKVPIDPQWKSLKLSFKARYKDVEVGDQTWKTARLAMNFSDKDGKKVGDWPEVWGETGTSDGWITFERQYKIPEGAAFLGLNPANFGKSGTVEFDDIKLTVGRAKGSLYVDPADARLPEKNIVENGNFEADSNKDGTPDKWDKREGISYPSENGKRWLKIDGGGKSVNRKLELEGGWGVLKMSFKARVADVVPGAEGWQNARMAMNFADEGGKKVGEWPDVFNWNGSTNGWVDCEREYKIPPGAEFLVLNPANHGKSGSVEFSDIVIKVVSMNYKGDMPLPEGADKEPWDIAKAWKKTSSTQEKICINGLWRVIPEVAEKTVPPADGAGWGWFKVPGVWPTQDWTVGDATQKFLLPPMSEDATSGKMIEQVWYKRDIFLPDAWAGRKIYLDFTLLQTNARIFLDGKDVGEIWFPGGRFDLTDFVEAGKKYNLTILVTARPLEAETKVFMAPDRIMSNKASVKLKGIAGDLFLCSEPKADAIQDLHVITSVAEGKISFKTKIGSPAAGEHVLSAKVLDRSGKEVKTFKSGKIPFTPDKSEYVFGGEWKDALLWDTNTPQNIYTAIVSIEDANGRKLDELLPVKFGFREFKIVGKDFYLNGKLIRLRALWVNSISDFADKCDYASGMNLSRRMKDYGFNFFITGNYDFEPGDVSYMDAIFDAADDAGMLASFSLPHIKNFKWLNSEAAVKNYGELTAWLISRMKNHPSIIMYAMNHNANGYHGDQNPLKMDGVYEPEKVPSELAKSKKGSYIEKREMSEKAASISKSYDPTRPVYHHQCGNLGDLYTVNCYLNWAPRQERSEWMEHWNRNGVKPFFFVEWGLPHISSWSSYRGPEFIWRCVAFQSVWDSEFASSILGEGAYEMIPAKIKLIDIEEKNYATGKPFHWGGVLTPTLSNMEKNHREIMAYYASDNWRSHRAWGVSAMLPWDQSELWERVNPTPDKPNEAKYKDLQKPGIVPDVSHRGGQFIHDPGDIKDFKPSSIGSVFLRNNREFLGFIGGTPKFTDKSHNFAAGENVSKQLVMINDSRENRKCSYSWKIDGAGLKGSGESDLKPGEIKFVPVDFKMPAGREKLELAVEFDFAGGRRLSEPSAKNEIQSDTFSLDLVKADTAKVATKSKVMLFDPEGITAKSLDAYGVAYSKINSPAEVAKGDILVIGRNALSKNEPLYDLNKVADGLKVVVFEQDDTSFFNKIGFRVNVQGIRNVFARVKTHPVLEGVTDDMLRDWRGSATLMPPNLEVAGFEEKDPQWEWCGFLNTRVWRCGTRGNICSVMIEKPERGSWLPILDCGFDMQYSPLLEYSQGAGKIIFCQLDVSGRTENDPVGANIVRNIFKYMDAVKAGESRKVLYAGDAVGSKLLEDLGVNFAALKDGEKPSGDSLLVVSPGAKLANMKDAVASGANLLALGLDEKAVNELLPDTAKMGKFSGYSSLVKDLAAPEFTGISNSELHWRGKLDFDGFADKGDTSCDMLKSIKIGKGTAVFCQLAPWNIDYVKKPYQRTSFRRNVFMVSRLLANLGASSESPLLANFARMPAKSKLKLAEGWIGEADKDNSGDSKGWSKEEFDDSAWRPIQVPGMFDMLRKDLDGYDGYFWYRLKFKTPEGFDPNAELVLKMGAIDDESWIWLNGKFLGEVTKTSNPKDYYVAPRTYTLKPGMLKKDGVNTLVVKVNDTYLNGGIKDMPFLNKNGAPWLNTYYLQEPIADDDPYRYYRW